MVRAILLLEREALTQWELPGSELQSTALVMIDQ